MYPKYKKLHRLTFLLSIYQVFLLIFQQKNLSFGQFRKFYKKDSFHFQISPFQYGLLSKTILFLKALKVSTVINFVPSDYIFCTIRIGKWIILSFPPFILTLPPSTDQKRELFYVAFSAF